MIVAPFSCSTHDPSIENLEQVARRASIKSFASSTSGGAAPQRAVANPAAATCQHCQPPAGTVPADGNRYHDPAGQFVEDPPQKGPLIALDAEASPGALKVQVWSGYG
jgi:hypothetical protein